MGTHRTMLLLVTCGPKAPPGIHSVVQVLVSLLLEVNSHRGCDSDAGKDDRKKESCCADLHQSACHSSKSALLHSTPVQSSASRLLWQEAVIQTEDGLNILMR